MRFALLFAAVALQAAPVLYTGIADATKFHNYTQKHYGVDGHPDKLLFMFWSQSMDTVADVWLESLDGQHVSETSRLTTEIGAHNGVPTLFLFGWLNVGTAPAPLIYGDQHQARLWMLLDGDSGGSGVSGVQTLATEPELHTISLWVALRDFGPYEEAGGSGGAHAPEPASVALALAGLALIGYRIAMASTGRPVRRR